MYSSEHSCHFVIRIAHQWEAVLQALRWLIPSASCSNCIPRHPLFPFATCQAGVDTLHCLLWVCNAGLGWQRSLQKRSLTTGQRTWKCQGLKGKGRSTEASPARSPADQAARQAHLPPEDSSTPSPRVQVQGPTLGSSRRKLALRPISPSPRRACAGTGLLGCFLGQYVELQLLCYFGYSTSFT